MRPICSMVLSILLIAGCYSCTQTSEKSDSAVTKKKNKVIREYRDDGTLSTASQVDEKGFAHGIKASYYEDGKSIHSKVSYQHGVKHGPAIWYYRSGKMYEYTSFMDGKRDGVTKKYYKNGQLLSQCEYKEGSILPGLIEYTEDGTRITDYPEVRLRKVDRLAFENRVLLEISSSIESNRVKYYYLLENTNGKKIKAYLEVNRGVSKLEFFVPPGDILLKKIELYAELPTK